MGQAELSYSRCKSNCEIAFERAMLRENEPMQAPVFGSIAQWVASPLPYHACKILDASKRAMCALRVCRKGGLIMALGRTLGYRGVLMIGGENMFEKTSGAKAQFDAFAADAFCDARVAASCASIDQVGVTYSLDEVRARSRMRVARMAQENPREGGSACFQ